jgi:hypothetical protein
MASFAAAVRTANKWSLILREKFPGIVVSVAPKMINPLDAGIFVGVCSLIKEGEIPTSISALDEKDQESTEQIPVIVEFSGPVNPFHKEGHR